MEFIVWDTTGVESVPKSRVSSSTSTKVEDGPLGPGLETTVIGKQDGQDPSSPLSTTITIEYPTERWTTIRRVDNRPYYESLFFLL